LNPPHIIRQFQFLEIRQLCHNCFLQLPFAKGFYPIDSF
jgi:hypothetical protein